MMKKQVPTIAQMKRLEISKEIAVTEPYVIKIIKELCPEGVTYANRVMELAVNLSDVLDSFYTGAFLPDYGIYPFLIVKEYHYQENCRIIDSVIVKSKFDIDALNDFVDALSVPENVKDNIKLDVRASYANIDEKFDVVYLDIMNYLIEYFRCLKKKYDYARSETERIFSTPVGYSCFVSLDGVLTLSYLMKRVNKFNKKGAASGKCLLVLKVGSSDDKVIVSCEKYKKK